ncbi:MAG TPA: DUF6596 domain-containing protein, partial [Acidimicrobiales bacterium]|nr:DUF6596 domain-containing protein [Acidimicrobiales bacterium]
ANQYRADDARRRREDVAAGHLAAAPADPAPGDDDSAQIMLLCCHPSLAPGAAIPLTLRAVGGLTTREIAAAFLVPEATMAQRITRAKTRLRDVADDGGLGRPSVAGDRLRSVLRVFYLVYNEGYEVTAGPDLGRPDLALEAIRLARLLRPSTPDAETGEVDGLLALMLLAESRRPARTTADGGLIPLADQDRSRWDQDLIRAGLQHATAAMHHGPLGEYGLQAAIQGLHAQAPSHRDTRWADIAALYQRLETLTGNPVVRLNRAVAVAMTEGPRAGLDAIADLDRQLAHHHRLASVRAHLHEMAGDKDDAVKGFRLAAARTLNTRERDFLLIQAARVTNYGCRPPFPPPA